MVHSSRPSARSSLAAVLIPGLLVAGSMTVTAEEPAGPMVVVTAPDDPSMRASLAFPPGWRLEAETDDTSRRNVNALAIDERCEVGTRRSDFPDLVTDVDDFLVALEPGSGFVLIGRESVELPAGPAERIDFAAEDEGGRWPVYAVWDGGYIHRYLSLARSVTWLVSDAG